MTFGSLFAGIGGLDLGLERAGLKCVWQVEQNEYACKVLERHWPAVRRWRDVRTFLVGSDANGKRRNGNRNVDDVLPERGEIWNGSKAEWRCDLICGGFPCQPVSVAGRRQAQRDPRWLWPHFARVVRLLRPKYVLVENVPGLLVRGSGMGDVLGELSEMGFDAEWSTLPASAFGAPHLRERVFIVAYASGEPTERGRCGTGGQGRQPPGALESAALRQTDGATRAEGAGADSSPTADTRSNGRQARIGISGNEKGQRKRRNQFGSSSEVAADRGSEQPQARIFRQCREIAALPLPCWGTDKPGVARTLNGVPNRVHRIEGIGNAVVPAVGEFLGRLILEAAG